MIDISLELIIALVGAVTGIIGTITGIISLIWHIQINKPKLVLERAYFEWVNQHERNPPKDKDVIKVEMILDNTSNRSTTVKDVGLWIGNQVISENSEYLFNQPTIMGGSSKTLTFYLNFKKDEFKSYFDENGEIKLGIEVFHTFGRIKKIAPKMDFDTGWLNLI